VQLLPLPVLVHLVLEQQRVVLALLTEIVSQNATLIAYTTGRAQQATEDDDDEPLVTLSGRRVT
jgi:hypothetical protein